MSAKPDICILKTDGTNCDQEMSYAFELAGATPNIVHINEMRSGDEKLSNYDGLGLPGGFSYGDDIASGAVLANELTAYLGEELQTFVDNEKPILGVCNGFQVLTRTGLLPNRTIGEQSATLARNNVGHFVCEWVDLAVEDNISKFVQPEDVEGYHAPMQIAHGEGRFMAHDDVITKMIDKGQVVFTYDVNPNGSRADIAGICDPTGLVLGMMPHPERSVRGFHPDHSRTAAARQAAEVIFTNIVNYTKES